MRRWQDRGQCWKVSKRLASLAIFHELKAGGDKGRNWGTALGVSWNSLVVSLGSSWQPKSRTTDDRVKFQGKF